MTFTLLKRIERKKHDAYCSQGMKNNAAME
jgi:hypothetical protein